MASVRSTQSQSEAASGGARGRDRKRELGWEKSSSSNADGGRRVLPERGSPRSSRLHHAKTLTSPKTTGTRMSKISRLSKDLARSRRSVEISDLKDSFLADVATRREPRGSFDFDVNLVDDIANSVVNGENGSESITNDQSSDSKAPGRPSSTMSRSILNDTLSTERTRGASSFATSEVDRDRYRSLRISRSDNEKKDELDTERTRESLRSGRVALPDAEQHNDVDRKHPLDDSNSSESALSIGSSNAVSAPVEADISDIDRRIQALQSFLDRAR